VVVVASNRHTTPSGSSFQNRFHVPRSRFSYINYFCQAVFRDHETPTHGHGERESKEPPSPLYTYTYKRSYIIYLRAYITKTNKPFIPIRSSSVSSIATASDVRSCLEEYHIIEIGERRWRQQQQSCSWFMVHVSPTARRADMCRRPFSGHLAMNGMCGEGERLGERSETPPSHFWSFLPAAAT
jgi:hypothetical protein